MEKSSPFVGMEVHGDSIEVAVADATGAWQTWSAFGAGRARGCRCCSFATRLAMPERTVPAVRRHSVDFSFAGSDCS